MARRSHLLTANIARKKGKKKKRNYVSPDFIATILSKAIYRRTAVRLLASAYGFLLSRSNEKADDRYQRRGGGVKLGKRGSTSRGGLIQVLQQTQKLAWIACRVSMFDIRDIGRANVLFSVHLFKENSVGASRRC